MIHPRPRASAHRRFRARGLAGALAAVTLVALVPPPTEAANSSTAYTYTKISNPDSSGVAWSYRVVATSSPGPKGGAPVTTGDLDTVPDGVADFLVAQPAADKVDLISGRTLQRIRTFRASDSQGGRQFGFAVSVLGDVTGDSRPDIAIGNDAQDVGGRAFQGKLWVFNGANGDRLYSIDHPTPQSYARFGSRIGRAGYVDNDKVPDMVVGSSNSDVCTTQECLNDVAQKGPAGDNACGAVSNPPPNGCRVDQGQAFVFSGANGALIRVLDMPSADYPASETCMRDCGSFGVSVQGPGDINRDEVGDQLISAASYNGGRGRMYLFSGATGALLARIDAPVPEEGANFGFQDAAPLSPGDVNGDGVPDLYGNGFAHDVQGSGVLGSEVKDMAGRAWVFDGAGTVNAASSAGQQLYEVVSPEPKPGGQFGWTMATTDYDRDGRPDLYVGSAPHHLQTAPDTSGGTYVFKGADGAHLKTLVLTGEDQQVGMRDPVKGTVTNSGSALGWGLAAPGDLNGDGDPDYLAGAPYQDVGSTVNAGQVMAFMSPGPDLRRAVADFDANRTSDVSVFRPSQGIWYVRDGLAAAYGTNGDIPVPGDYDGNRSSDVAVFRPSQGMWYVKDGAATAWGTNGDIPVPGDYDANGSTDIAVFRPSSGTWFVRNGAMVNYGTNGDIPVPADYDGDYRTDIAVFRPSSGLWYIRPSAGGPDRVVAYGTNGDVPVPGDFDGDTKADVGVFRPSSGVWYLRQSGGGADRAVNYGTNGDRPVPGDFDGDRRADIGVFRPSSGTWYLRPSGGGPDSAIGYGTSGDIPLPMAPSVRQVVFP